jgi:ChpA-C
MCRWYCSNLPNGTSTQSSGICARAKRRSCEADLAIRSKPSTSAAAIAITGGPAFASNNPVVGNIAGNGNIPILSGNNVRIPVRVPVGICGNAVGLLGFANASSAGAPPRPSWTASTAKLTSVVKGGGTRRPLP